FLGCGFAALWSRGPGSVWYAGTPPVRPWHAHGCTAVVVHFRFLLSKFLLSPFAVPGTPPNRNNPSVIPALARRYDLIPPMSAKIQVHTNSSAFSAYSPFASIGIHSWFRPAKRSPSFAFTRVFYLPMSQKHE